MSPLQIMETKKGDFTPNELTIYETIMANPASIVSMTTSALARECGVSQPAITRFIKNLGYPRFLDFRTALIYELSSQAEHSPHPAESSAPSSGQTPADHALEPSRPENKALQEFIQHLDACEDIFSDPYLQETARYLAGFRRIYAAGIAKSYQPAELFEILSRKLNRRIHAVRFDFMNEVCDYLGSEDLLIIFSVSASSEIISYINSTQAKVMLVTANPNPACAEFVDRVVYFPVGKGHPEDVPVSPVLFDIFVDLLVKTMLVDDPLPKAEGRSRSRTMH